jgi:hypothetical protein
MGLRETVLSEWAAFIVFVRVICQCSKIITTDKLFQKTDIFGQGGNDLACLSPLLTHRFPPFFMRNCCKIAIFKQQS